MLVCVVWNYSTATDDCSTVLHFASSLLGSCGCNSCNDLLSKTPDGLWLTVGSSGKCANICHSQLVKIEKYSCKYLKLYSCTVCAGSALENYLILGFPLESQDKSEMCVINYGIEKVFYFSFLLVLSLRTLKLYKWNNLKVNKKGLKWTIPCVLHGALGTCAEKR